MGKILANTVFLVLFSILSISFSAFSQREGNIWYFGGNAGISFNGGNPTALTNSAMFQYDGCATISDSTGKLLFYSNGVNVWNKNHVIMDNGNGLKGGYASTQSCVAVKKPKCDSLYYLFTVDDAAGPDGFRYSIISMNRNGGLGKVITKNIPLLYPTTEKVTAVRHRNKTDIWVITHGWDTNAFFAYRITPTGLNTTPVVSKVGYKHTGSLTRTAGYMKVSPNGKKLAWAMTNYSGIVEILDFDDSTGVVSNPISCNTIKDPYGIEFSPDGTKLYVSSRSFKEIYEFFLDAGSPSLVLSSLVKVATGTAQLGAMQVAIDGRIYVAREDKYLGIINSPNAYGAGCKYVDKAFYLAGKDSKFGLPTFNQSYFYNPEYSFENFCYGDTTIFKVNSSSLIDSIIWNFGDASTQKDTSSALVAKYKYPASGIYNVNLIVYLISSKVDTLTWTLKIHPKPLSAFNINDSTQCESENLAYFFDNSTISTGTLKSYWEFGDFDTSTLVNPSHKYMTDDTFSVNLISISDKGCKDTSSHKMIIFPSPLADFEMNDSAQCFDRNKYEFTNKSQINYGMMNYDWDFGDGNTSKFDNPTHIYTVADTFTVRLIATSNHFCRDTVFKSTYIMINPTPISAFSIDDTFQCLYGNIFKTTNNSYLSMGTMSYRWSFGDGDSSYAMEPQHTYANDGTYTVKLTVISDKNCKDSKIKKVYVNAEPQASFTVDDSAQCLRNNKVKFSNKTTINSGKVDYTWDFGDNSFSNLINPDHTYTSNDTFIVSLLVVSDAGCVDSSKMAMIVYPMPIVDFSINNTNQCIKSNAFIYTDESSIANGSITTRIWEMGDGTKYFTKNAAHNYTTDGTYDVRLTLVSNLGCRDSITKKVFVFPMPKADFSINKIDQCLDKNFFICRDSSKITSGVISSFLWNMDDGNQYTDKIVYHNYEKSDTFNIKLKVISGQGCIDSIIRKVIVYPMPKTDFDINDPVQCLSGNSFTFQNKTTISSGSINSITWNLGDGTKAGTNNVTHSYSTYDTFFVQLVSVSGVGCRDSIKKPIYIYAMPKADFTVSPVKQCLLGNNFSFSNKSSVIYGNISGYLWQFDDGATSSSPNPSYQYSGDKTYGVKLLVTSNFGCKDSVTKGVTVDPMPQVDFNITNPCLDKTTFFEDITRINGPGKLQSWDWQINGVSFSAIQNPQNTFTTPGIYQIKLIVTSTDACQSSFTKFIKINEHVSQNQVIRATVANDNEILIEWTPSTTGSVRYYKLERSDDGINYSVLANLPSNTLKFTDKNVNTSQKSYYYRVAVDDSCSYTTPYSNIGKTILLNVNTDGDQPALSWNIYQEWTDGVLNQEIQIKDDKNNYNTLETVDNTVTSFTDSKTDALLDEYCYKIINNKADGTTFSSSNIVCVSVPLLVYPPNAFTPNHDDVNDEFIVLGKYVTDFSIQIFDRWGDLLFESNDMTKGWDGKYNGQYCDPGLYYFRLVAKGTKSQMKSVTGVVHLLR